MSKTHRLILANPGTLHRIFSHFDNTDESNLYVVLYTVGWIITGFYGSQNNSLRFVPIGEDRQDTGTFAENEK